MVMYLFLYGIKTKIYTDMHLKISDPVLGNDSFSHTYIAHKIIFPEVRTDEVSAGLNSS